METYSQSKIQSWLPWFLRGILIFGFFILFARLIDLSIIRGKYFRSLSEQNRIRRVLIIAPRGKVFARGGETLIGNSQVELKIMFDPEKGYEKVYKVVKDDEDVITEPVRNYMLGSKFAHISGYLGEVDETEVGRVDPRCLEKGEYKLGSLIGKTGLEKQYECILRGIDGEELIEVDSVGRKVRVLGKKEPIAGMDIKTTINIGLQKKVSELLENEKGAIVVSDMRGEVLAMYSSPSYDPNIFIDSKQTVEINTILNDSGLPMFNRSISGIFHPGSVIKPLVAVAALEEGVIDKDYRYHDEGIITIESLYGEFTYSNWYFTQHGGREGEIDLTRAIARSTDTFFYKTGELLGIEKLDEWFSRFGLDKLTNIDIPTEVAGLVPSPEWKRLVKGERWFLGNTYHISIGQGDIALTPLGINTAIASIAGGGDLCIPHVIGGGESQNFQFPISNLEETSSAYFQCKDLEISQGNIDLVKEGMIKACSPGGTAFPFFEVNGELENDSEKVACKTGTAETDEEDKTHAWLTFFAPSEEPEIVVTVLVEKGGEGSDVAAPIAREIYDYWFLEKNE
jgi:penicillin-binding protein 2